MSARLRSPGVDAGEKPTSQPLSFWYGAELPEAQGDAIHQALVGPLRELIDAMAAYDNSGGQRGLIRGREPEDVARLQRAGASAFLVGESLMREPDPGLALRRLLGTP